MSVPSAYGDLSPHTSSFPVVVFDIIEVVRYFRYTQEAKLCILQIKASFNPRACL